MDWEFGFSRLYIGRINSKVLLYSTGNYIQCPVISQNGKEYEKRHPQPSARLLRVTGNYIQCPVINHNKK